MTVPAAHGLPYELGRKGKMIYLSRQTPDGQYVHRILMSKRDAYRIADALVDLAEGNAAA